MSKETKKKYTKEHNMDSENKMEEITHFAITFTETKDGYKLEASGDKDALRRLGIGPRMLDKRRTRSRAGRHARRRRRDMAQHQLHRGRAFGHGRSRAMKARQAAYRNMTF